MLNKCLRNREWDRPVCSVSPVEGGLISKKTTKISLSSFYSENLRFLSNITCLQSSGTGIWMILLWFQNSLLGPQSYPVVAPSCPLVSLLFTWSTLSFGQRRWLVFTESARNPLLPPCSPHALGSRACCSESTGRFSSCDILTSHLVTR